MRLTGCGPGQQEFRKASSGDGRRDRRDLFLRPTLRQRLLKLSPRRRTCIAAQQSAGQYTSYCKRDATPCSVAASPSFQPILCPPLCHSFVTPGTEVGTVAATVTPKFSAGHSHSFPPGGERDRPKQLGISEAAAPGRPAETDRHRIDAALAAVRSSPSRLPERSGRSTTR